MTTQLKMFRINPNTTESQAITEVEFSRLGFREPRDIQEWVANNPSILGDELLIVSKEFSGFDRTNECLDLLAIDPDGKLVVIELKTDDSGADTHWQAIKYASYLSRATSDDIISMLSQRQAISEDDAGSKILHHIGADDLGGLNRDQRIILASHRFAPEVTSAALWLNNREPGGGLITCVQLIPYHDPNSNSLYIQASTIIPVPDTGDLRVGIGDGVQQHPGSPGLKEKGRNPLQPNQDDEVGHFLQKVANTAIAPLSPALKPDRMSPWAGSSAGGHLRYFHLWYQQNSPWSDSGLFYDLVIEKDNRARVGVTHSKREGNIPPLTKGETDSLWATLDLLPIHENQQSHQGNYGGIVFVGFEYETLNDQLADNMATALRRFIEVVTPAVEEFEAERTTPEI